MHRVDGFLSENSSENPSLIFYKWPVCQLPVGQLWLLESALRKDNNETGQNFCLRWRPPYGRVNKNEWGRLCFREKLRNGYAEYLHTALIVLDLCWHIPEDSHIRSYQLCFCTVLGMYTCLSCIRFHLYQNKKWNTGHWLYESGLSNPWNSQAVQKNKIYEM